LSNDSTATIVAIEAHYVDKKAFLQLHSREYIASKISKDLRGLVAGQTILQYFNEHEKHDGFKEDMRGKHQV
jgi:hypothetical protein